MANTLIPVEERSLTPDEVARLDRRRRNGHLCQCIGWQCLLISALVLLWSGQDTTYSPHLIHPMLYWDMFTFTLAMVMILIGVNLKRGSNEFFSY